MVLNCKDVAMEFGVNVILKNVSFILEEGEKLALIGVNGAGKTTLLKILTGEYTRTSGEITMKKDAKIGYLAQMKDLEQDKTIHDEILSVFSHLVKIEKEMAELEAEMSLHKDDSYPEELARLFERYSKLQHSYEQQDGYEYRSRVKGIIAGLGFSTLEGEMPINLLSGGQKTRVSLGKLLLSQHEVLLLDEPTNHLDIQSVEWLESVFLANYKGAVIIVTHDRYFIDKTADKIVEIENGRSMVYNGNYSYYAYRKENDREIMLKHFMEQQKEIKRQEEIIRMYRSYATEKMIIRAKSKEKLLAKVERIDKPESRPDNIHFVFEPKVQSGNDVLNVENLAKSFEDFKLFENVSFDIKRGQTVALIGANGIGKTTLMKILLRQVEFNSGYIKKGTNVNIGYYDQEHTNFDEQKTIFQEISDSYPRMTNQEIRNLLACFVFYGDEVFKSISNLSGGEKGRLSLSKLMLSQNNFLFLDEPTNHLDMQSKEILEEALRSYTGTILYISHDRYFINNTADKVLELTRDGANVFLGNYDYYVEKKKELKEATIVLEDSAAKGEWISKKGQQSDIRRRKSRIEKIEKTISELEARVLDCDDKLGSPDVFSDHIKSREVFELKQQTEADIHELYAEWEELHL